MRLTISITLQQSPMGPTTALGMAEFKKEQGRELELKSEVAVPNHESLTLRGAMTSNHMYSLAGFVGKKQLFLFSGEWDRKVPYLGIELSEAGFLHFYFKKEPEASDCAQ
jgi:hypothetical protein